VSGACKSSICNSPVGQEGLHVSNGE
jgi:hypothetical protein